MELTPRIANLSVSFVLWLVRGWCTLIQYMIWLVLQSTQTVGYRVAFLGATCVYTSLQLVVPLLQDAGLSIEQLDRSRKARHFAAFHDAAIGSLRCVLCDACVSMEPHSVLYCYIALGV